MSSWLLSLIPFASQPKSLTGFLLTSPASGISMLAFFAVFSRSACNLSSAALSSGVAAGFVLSSLFGMLPAITGDGVADGDGAGVGVGLAKGEPAAGTNGGITGNC